MNVIKRGDIWMADLGSTKGSEQGGKRPCLVISNDKGNAYSPTIIILPLTKHKKKFDLTHVTMEVKQLNKPSYILCEQVRTIDRSRVYEYVCHVSDEIMEEVREKMLLTQGL